MRIVSFSDMSQECMEQLLGVVKTIRPDVIVYAGGRMGRFREEKMHGILTSLTKCSKECVVVSSDGRPFDIKGVIDVCSRPLVIGRSVFYGVPAKKKGSRMSGAEVFCDLCRARDAYPGRRLIVVSESAPLGVLDVDLLRGECRHAGSQAVRRFLDVRESKEILLLAGASRFEGGKTTRYKDNIVVNLSSKGGEFGRIYVMDVSEKEVAGEWRYVYDMGVVDEELDELMGIPFVKLRRAQALQQMGIHSMKDMVAYEKPIDVELYPCFSQNDFLMAQNFTRAILKKAPLIVRKHEPFDPKGRPVWFFDAEFLNGRDVEIFLIGLIDEKGKKVTFFLDRGHSERNMMKEFLRWLKRVNPVLVAYGSTSSDVHQLENSLKRCGLKYGHLKEHFYDVFVECVNAQHEGRQWVYLPIRKRMTDDKPTGLKGVSELLGYVEKADLETTSGFEALIRYGEYLRSGDPEIKEDLIVYNESDLWRTKYVFEKMKVLIAQSEKS